MELYAICFASFQFLLCMIYGVREAAIWEWIIGTTNCVLGVVEISWDLAVSVQIFFPSFLAYLSYCLLWISEEICYKKTSREWELGEEMPWTQHKDERILEYIQYWIMVRIDCNLWQTGNVDFPTKIFWIWQ